MMSFKPVSSKVELPAMEMRVLDFWKERHIFKKSLRQRHGRPEYVFYEGPPTANGRPGSHHVLARVFKDLFPRYKPMRGYHVVRRGGWDTHGLPVEIDVEKRLGFTNKQQIEEYGLEKFNELCRQSVFDYVQEWESLTERIGFWVDTENAYVTYSNDYIESVWWILKNLWDRGLLYQDYKVVPYCPRCGTPLSDHEVALGYEETTDPSLFVRMRLRDEPNTFLLVWTTTPWTLPGNVAVATNPNETYVTVEHIDPEGKRERLVLAEALVEKVFGDERVHVVARYPGKALANRRYEPLFDFITPDKPAHFVILQDFVSVDDGTGLVHIAPAFGAEDMQAARDRDLPVLVTVAADGTFTPEVTAWRGRFVKDADPDITRHLAERGLLLKEERYTHTYPFCWRCQTPLLYYARTTWYIRTTAYKERLVALNQEINWYPEHIKNGRFGNWLENNVDWALGRERYWGTPLPVWQCDVCEHQVCAGSVQELSDLAGRELRDLDLHRPYVDEVHFACPECGGRMSRTPDLIDVWFDSGSMPLAQWHYPFENQETFEAQFPADYICEAVDQTRGWFYSLHAISTLLFDRPSYKNVICLGLILDGEGNKMSKSRGNIVEPGPLLEAHGADAFRWYLYSASPPGKERRFSSELVGDVVRRFTLTLWNVYAFFVTYANLDGWQPDSQRQPSASTLDRWLRSSLHTLVQQVTAALDSYDVPGATRPVEAFVDNLSNWYLRRSRHRFWKSESDEDKQAAYATLYEALVTLSKLLAPSMPFLAEELYQNLVRTSDDSAPESVHLAAWPEVNAAALNANLEREMTLVMKLASLGHAARNKAGVKVRQPLAEVAFAVGGAQEAQVVTTYADLLAAELNIKRVRVLGSAGEAVSYRLNPLPRQLGAKYQSRFPAVRQALLGLNADAAATRLMAGESIKVAVNGETLEILPSEVEVRAEARTGLTVAVEGPYLAALTTELTPELLQEGLAREFVRHVQECRKEAGFDVSDRIHLYYTASNHLAQAIDAFGNTIMGETLAVELIAAGPPPKAYRQALTLDGETLTFGLVKAT
ncbi:MAG TPA: isoleucine--tRNA ligase [Anaerolineae bacterium]